ncbi:AAA family ATPase [Pectobacterium brasiliense]|uniref:AAA family ATPase n=1 Tax=Pectobacterium brasiliense TaxID=180957 RepID=UPI0036718EC8
MIKPIRFYAKNYKAYKEINLDVGKFNVFIGKNSAGKSALARLAPLILKSLNVGSGNVVDYTPLDIDIGASYHDVVHGHNEYTRLELGATFDCDGEQISFVTELTFSTELKTLLVSNFKSIYKDITYQAELDLEGLEKNGSVKYIYEGKVQELVFDGLIPKNLKDSDNVIFILLENVRNYDFDISYLGPFCPDSSVGRAED